MSKSKVSFVFLVLMTIGINACVNENRSSIAKIKNKKKDITTIYIQPFYGFPKKRTLLISNELKAFYKINTTILPLKNIYLRSVLNGTNRYDAGNILNELKKVIKNPQDKILGLTSFDIYTPKDVKGIHYPYWGIFGLGYCPGKSCIISDFRLNQFGNKATESVIKVVLHEIGHTFGLPHCDKDPRCLMNDAKGTIKTLYKEEKWLCPNCRIILEKSDSYKPKRYGS